jgi:transposase-like protein
VTERELERQARRRLTILRHAEEVSGSVAETCRYYGIGRPLFYRWRRRYEEEGDGLQPRSRRPKTSPRATSTKVVGKVIYLRTNDHFGPRRSRCT